MQLKWQTFEKPKNKTQMYGRQAWVDPLPYHLTLIFSFFKCLPFHLHLAQAIFRIGLLVHPIWDMPGRQHRRDFPTLFEEYCGFFKVPCIALVEVGTLGRRWKALLTYSPWIRSPAGNRIRAALVGGRCPTSRPPEHPLWLWNKWTVEMSVHTVIVRAKSKGSSEKESEASTRFKLITSAISVRCSTFDNDPFTVIFST